MHPAASPTKVLFSGDSNHLAFLLALLNKLDINAYDVGKAYFIAFCSENICFVAKLEFGSLNGSAVRSMRARYGLKSIGALWRAPLKKCWKWGFIQTLVIQVTPDNLLNFLMDSNAMIL